MRISYCWWIHITPRVPFKKQCSSLNLFFFCSGIGHLDLSLLLIKLCSGAFNTFFASLFFYFFYQIGWNRKCFLTEMVSSINVHLQALLCLASPLLWPSLHPPACQRPTHCWTWDQAGENMSNNQQVKLLIHFISATASFKYSWAFALVLTRKQRFGEKDTDETLITDRTGRTFWNLFWQQALKLAGVEYKQDILQEQGGLFLWLPCCSDPCFYSIKMFILI